MRDTLGRFVDGQEGKATRFAPGTPPWNKDKTGYMGANVTSYKPGQESTQAKPKGTISQYTRHRRGRVEVVVEINVDWHGGRKPHNNYAWYLWEVENQEDRPPGIVLLRVNGIQDDIRLENLQPITRAELLRLNS